MTYDRTFKRAHWECRACGAVGMVLFRYDDTPAKRDERLAIAHHAQKRRDQCPTPDIVVRAVVP